MATYKEIHGIAVKDESSDPTTTGEIFYNSTTDTFRSIVQSAAWSSGAPMSIAVCYRFGGGTPTATFAAGGSPSPVGGVATEEYNGSGWATGGNIGTSRYEGGSAGTLTAGLIYGGYFSPPGSIKNETEEYNGTAWSEQNNLNNGRYSQGGFGTQTAAVYSSGFNPGRFAADTEEYDGTSWTEGNNPSVTRNDVGTAGTLTAGMIFGGQSPGPTLHANTEFYDGTNWTTGPAMNTARSQLGGSGTQTAAIGFGGRSTPVVALTEQYDGTSWSETADLATARRQISSNRSNTGNSAALGFGGNIPPQTTATEEFSQSTNVVTAGAWASGATYPLSLNQLGGSGTQTAGLCFGGNLPPGNPNGSNQTKEYDGSAWTAGGNLNQSKDTGSRSGVGTQTATMCINFRNDGVATPSFPIPPANHNYRALENVEEYNGSSWTNGTNTPDGEVEAGTCGTISAALRFGGNPGNPPGGPYTNSTIYWNDSSWTSLNNMSTARSGLAPAFQGTYNAALGFGGETATPTEQTATEEFDGTNWTAGGNMVTAVSRHSGSGTQTAALAFGGTPSITRTEGYDGTAWSTRPSLANGRSFGGGAGSSTAALYMCGDGTTHVEEFTGETTAANVKTITTS